MTMTLCIGNVNKVCVIEYTMHTYGWPGLFGAPTVMNDQARVNDFKLKSHPSQWFSNMWSTGLICFVLQVGKKNYSTEYFKQFTKLMWYDGITVFLKHMSMSCT
jgi:hypothetical protein